MRRSRRFTNFLETAKSFHICIRAYPMLINWFTLAGERDRVLATAEEALTYFEGLSYFVKLPREIFSLLSIPILIETGRYQEAEELLDKYTPKGKTRNYFKFLQLNVISQLRQNNITDRLGANPKLLPVWCPRRLPRRMENPRGLYLCPGRPARNRTGGRLRRRKVPERDPVLVRG